jgi:hypothetical protein
MAMDRFFSIFGKFALVLLVIAVLVGGGYFLGTGKLPFPMNPTPGAVTTAAPEPVAPTPTPTDEHAITEVPSPTPQAGQIVTGGGLTGTSFTSYTLTVPVSWTVKKESTPNVSETMTVSRGDYAIHVYQAATGGGGCTYPGDPAQEMSSPFGAYTTIHDGLGNKFRRATPAGSSGFTVCQKAETGFGLPTVYGHVTYETPAAPDTAILQEMDAIFATFKH